MGCAEITLYEYMHAITAGINCFSPGCFAVQ